MQDDDIRVIAKSARIRGWKKEGKKNSGSMPTRATSTCVYGHKFPPPAPGTPRSETRPPASLRRVSIHASTPSIECSRSP